MRLRNARAWHLALRVAPPPFRGRALLQALGSSGALCLVVLGVWALNGPISPPATQDLVDASGWQAWLSGVGVGQTPEGSIWNGSVGDEIATIEPSDPEDYSRFIRVDVTGYTSRIEETDADPFITAMCTVTGTGVMALSRDLLRTFTPNAPFDFGDKVMLPGVGIFSIEDTMHPRWQRRADIWFTTTDEAYAWGRRVGFLGRVDSTTPVFAPEPDLASAVTSSRQLTP